MLHILHDEIVGKKHSSQPKFWHNIDISLVVILPFLAALLSEIFHLNYLSSALVFFGIPSIYLSMRRPALIRKSVLLSLIFSVLAIVVFDYMAFADLSWWVPNSIFRFLSNGIPIEDIPWTFLWAYYTITFWEFFLDHDRNKAKINPKVRYLVAFVSFLLTAFFFAYWLSPSVLVQPYFYVKWGVLFMVIPITAVLIKFPHLLRKICILGAYFFVVNALVEVTAIRQNQWIFTGTHFLATITLFGKLIPIEEILFFWLLLAPTLICWYEYFADDRK